MTIYTCQKCGKFFNNSLGKCPYCGTLVKDSVLTVADWITIETLIEKKIAEALMQHEEDFEHKEKPVSAEEVMREA